MTSLRDHLKGVQVDPPATELDDSQEPVVDDNSAPEDSEPKGRTVDNVYGEFSRKYGKLEAQIQAMHDMVADLKSAPPAAPQTPPAQRSIEDMSVAELESLASQIPEENKPQFDLLLAAARRDEKILQQVSTQTQNAQIETERQKYNQMAVERYPELSNPGSDIARRVEASLQGIPEQVATQNPRVVYDLANTAAMEMDIKPAIQRQPRKTASSNTAPAPTTEPETINTAERRKDIAKSLKNALPRGKDFNLDQIEENEKYWKNKLGDHIR